MTEQRVPANPGVGVQENIQRNGTGSPLYDRYYPQPNPPTHMPGVGSSLRQIPQQPTTLPPAPPPVVRLDRVVSAPRADLSGQVLVGNNTPRGNARLVFVSDARGANAQHVTADAAGHFRVTLASGGWLVYVTDGRDKPVFHSKIEMRENEIRQVTLVARQ